MNATQKLPGLETLTVDMAITLSTPAGATPATLTEINDGRLTFRHRTGFEFTAVHCVVDDSWYIGEGGPSNRVMWANVSDLRRVALSDFL